MIYLNETDLNKIGIPWDRTIDMIEDAVQCLIKADFAQPIKPYLRYRDMKNRIIAMPAFIGGEFNMAGIKWIASFPDNIEKGIARAHSTIILNQAETGIPLAVINAALLSIIRTAAVSGLMIRYFNAYRPLKNAIIGISGWGPIGQNHIRMLLNQFGDQINSVLVYDIRNVNTDINVSGKEKIIKVNRWQDAYANADVFITCTVSKKPYINLQPKASSLQLNVSLRDYEVETMETVRKSIIVDDWEEVCRENTDIENMHKRMGLQAHEVFNIKDVVQGCMKKFAPSQPIMFNPMGMAIFDIAVACFYLKQAQQNKIGTVLDD